MTSRNRLLLSRRGFIKATMGVGSTLTAVSLLPDILRKENFDEPSSL
ncbi:MAG: twin-arginine translocation signal domain-containing protein [Caldilineaceae bacterium]